MTSWYISWVLVPIASCCITWLFLKTPRSLASKPDADASIADRQELETPKETADLLKKTLDEETAEIETITLQAANDAEAEAHVADTSEVPSIETSPPEDDDSDSETVHGDDDEPPSFPLMNSAQRAAGGSQPQLIPRILTDAQLMPPPPLPSLAVRRPGNGSGPAPSSSLLPPATTMKPPPRVPREGRSKVALAPGHGPLDWANLKKSGKNLRGTEQLLRVTPSMLAQHKTREDVWMAIHGKVYNVTHYLPYHPGGVGQLMRAAGRDGSKLFALTHAWVNVDYMLDECLVGFLASESTGSAS